MNLDPTAVPVPPLTTADRIKLYQTFMQATKLEATIDGLATGSTAMSDERGTKRPILFMIQSNLPGTDVQVTTIEAKAKVIDQPQPVHGDLDSPSVLVSDVGTE